MVIFHVHECCIHIHLGIAVTAAKTRIMQIIKQLPVKKFMEQFKITLMYTFSFPTAMNENHAMRKAVIFQVIHNPLQVRYPVFFGNTEEFHIVPIQQNYCIFHLCKHFFFPFFNRFLPDKNIFVGQASSLVPSINTVSFDNLPPLQDGVAFGKTCLRRVSLIQQSVI